MKLVWSAFRELSPLLPRRANRFLWIYIVSSSALAILDVAALMILAVSLTSMLQGATISIPLIGEFGSNDYVWIILIISGLILTKSVLSVGLNWVATRRFAVYELEVGDRLFNAYIRAPWTERLKRSTAELVRMADVGIANAIAGFLLPLIGLPQMLTTSIAVFAVIAVAQPITALVTLLYLGAIAAVIYLWVSKKTVEAGRVSRDYAIQTAKLMTGMVSALKEITLRNRAPEVVDAVRATRAHSARARANLSFLGQFPRFVLDAAIVGGFVLVGGVGFLLGGASAAISAITLFGVGGFRLVPSLTGFQSVLTQATSNLAYVQIVISDIHEAKHYLDHAEQTGHSAIQGTPTDLELSHVSFDYGIGSSPAVEDISVRIPLGSTLGIVGSSGAGKSTLVDLLLGLLTPTGGAIKLGQQNLDDVLSEWRMRVGYVPQDVALFEGSIAQNVALTWGGKYDVSRVRDSLDRAQLLDMVDARFGGIEAPIGDRGLALSGGQRQRLGIARALYSDPVVLVLDEATSALDAKTEADVLAAIRALRGEVTVISVAHRLSTVKDNDLIMYLENGRSRSIGSFSDLVESVPEFAVQARLSGLIGAD